jgi:hypothetical protein
MSTFINFYQLLIRLSVKIKKSTPPIMSHFGAVTSQRPYSGRNSGFIRRALHSARHGMAYPRLDPTESRLIQPNPTSFSNLLIHKPPEAAKNPEMTK